MVVLRHVRRGYHISDVREHNHPLSNAYIVYYMFGIVCGAETLKYTQRPRIGSRQALLQINDR